MASQIKVRFFTRDEDESLHCPGNPVVVPISLKRYGLSEIVNHLVGLEQPVPFDFLIDGTLLKGSVEDYLVANGLSSEHFLDIEYTRAVLPPQFLASFNNDDWVSAIDSVGSMSLAGPEGEVRTAPKILTGSYDGVVRIYNASGKVETQLVGHQAAVKAVKFISPSRFVSAGMDRSLRLWKASVVGDEEVDKETQNGRTNAILEYHKDVVAALAVRNTRILSASYDRSLALWSTNAKEMHTTQPMEQGAENNLSSASRKRLKLAVGDASIRRKAPLAILEAHQGPVEAVCFDEDDTVAYSASQDHTVRTWDLVTARCIDTRHTNFALLSLVALPRVGLLATGSAARHINLHDPRAEKVTTTQLVGHKNFVVSLATTDNEYTLVSGSHDGTAKIWDIRANKSIYTIDRESGDHAKVLAVDWNAEIGLLSGGTDKKLQINELKSDKLHK
ncbi:hypothetical protein KL905_003347 [Ogataea polymorpha]|uniref:Ribosome biogenesis protein YTM1 n=1 Tax=Ogataea polymorpha TaxID=460523 RepID=A0A9P8TFL2_9ASCO|nr:hypothetical protein KL936_003718 [Ogataea polymorpha]KAG7892318.1 hypothetical protein KL908_003270 [Ogataea polymorpha]KAG7909093.1 hypothetical protein KL906_002587 [Ogataea polymorpha]KAG7916174.1 hypothetical protein KL927_003639 [Ogataea polymorpha]KAG7920713.1 hypothetical protein KL905_003347 [Ogataea polymorpha]